MIPPRWIVTANADPDATRRLAAELRIPEALAAILVQRGLASPDSAKAFLRPDLERLSDPHRLADMAAAVELLVRAVREQRPILVHGDYDVDGQCASAMLTRILRSAGATVYPFVPHRIRDGYDFGPAGLEGAQREALAGKRQEIAAERESATRARERAAKAVNPSLLARYDRIRRGKAPLAIYPLHGSSCGNCFTAVPTQRKALIQRGATIEGCEACGVLLYAKE
ncbi:MAG: hypothetical protein AUI86_06720 [Gemmatimonadetes bacterium 13_1_40CM_3_66_12]|nr:MAG: hypothetical protein AUI86_06720 [Gemmatimonadetes bacterium 13_1_40CM_3_66_12]